MAGAITSGPMNQTQETTRPAGPQTPRGRGARLAATLLSHRVRALWILGGAGFLVFSAARIILLIVCRDRLEGVTAAEIVRCLYVGARFDGFPVGIAGLPLALALSLAPDTAFGNAWFRRIVTAYVTALVATMVFVAIAGAFFFLQFGSRLNWIVVDYLAMPAEVLQYIWAEYPVLLIFGGLAIFVAALYWALVRMLWSGPRPSAPIWTRPVLCLCLVAMCVFGIRGKLTGKVLHPGAAYAVSNNNTVGQLTLNDVYSLVAALRSEWRDERLEGREFPLPPHERAEQVARAMLYQPQDVDLKRPDNPLWRRTVTGKPQTDYNVVLVLMESMAGKPVGLMGHSPSHTPNLDALGREGLSFDRMYAVGIRTRRSICNTLCGHPDFSEKSLLVRARALGRFLALPQFFRDRGYKTAFIYGGKPAWDNMQAFLAGGGVDEFIGQEDGPQGELVNPWGVADELTFKKAHDRFMAYGDQKFFGVILTITNHEPFRAPPGQVEFVPGDSLEARKINCIRYSDWALGEFFRQAREAPYFKRTIFVLVADHGIEFSPTPMIDAEGYRVPCVIYAPGIVPPGRIRTVASQTDIPPTILALLGGEFDHCFFGRNLLTVPPDDGFAFMRNAEMIGLVRGDRMIVLPPMGTPVLYRMGNNGVLDLIEGAPSEIAGLQEEALSYHYMSAQLYLDMKYRPPIVIHRNCVSGSLGCAKG
jgi:phosphoglycerol transferase MdoB-like AlkP superfamily enzyme